MSELIKMSELANKIPNFKAGLVQLQMKYGTIHTILANEKGTQDYYQLMVLLIAEKEKQEGNISVNGLKYQINLTTEEMLNKYMGTIWLPVYDKKSNQAVWS